MTGSKPLKVLFLWHHHQPYYKTDGTFQLPWVRMHGIKDYWDMVRILDDFPKIKQTFNFTPSLLEQLQEYLSPKNWSGDGGTLDIAYRLSLKNPDLFSPEDKSNAFKTFFLANTERMIKRYPRYAELMSMRGKINNDRDIENAVRNFSPQDFRDLQVWWNLAWVGEYSRFDPPFKRFLDKQRNFSEPEKLDLLKSQSQILRKIIPHHTEAARRGQIEISLSPFYHPILPLLCDSGSGAEANANTKLPMNRFRQPDDAFEQIESGLGYAEKMFGIRPKGMWPSEGSVSDSALEMIIRNRVAWVATDELILRKTFQEAGKEITNNFIEKYFAYSFGKGRSRVKIFFRDHGLSDLIGFTYSSMSPDDAANDMVSRLLKIRHTIQSNFDGETREFAVVPIILDGENAWEFYQSDGKDFLRTLYYKLSNEPRLETVLPSEVKVRRGNNLDHICPGSWINGDFNIWIGHPENNKAWDFLFQARSFYEKMSNSIPAGAKAKAYREIKIAEGSDWWWWYGDEHKSPQANEFDYLFRYHLKQVYILLGTNPPKELDEPIKKKAEQLSQQPVRMISPSFDNPDHEREWHGAGAAEKIETGGSMQMTGALVKRIYFGNDQNKLYLRIDTAKGISTEQIRISLLSNPKIDLEIGTDFVFRSERHSRNFEFAGRCLISDTIQVAINFGETKPEEVALTISIYDNGNIIDCFPTQGAFKFRTVQ